MVGIEPTSSEEALFSIYMRSFPLLLTIQWLIRKAGMPWAVRQCWSDEIVTERNHPEAPCMAPDTLPEARRDRWLPNLSGNWNECRRKRLRDRRLYSLKDVGMSLCAKRDLRGSFAPSACRKQVIFLSSPVIPRPRRPPLYFSFILFRAWRVQFRG